MKSSNNKRGFTLIELLAVIAILAILLIIAIPSVIKMYNNAKINTFVDEVQSVINTAEKQYMSDQINSDAPTCYSNEEGNDCPDLELSGNKNLKYYIGFDGGHIIEANVTDGSHAWDSGTLTRVDASSVKAGDVTTLGGSSNTYTITYDANTGTNAPTSQTKTKGEALIITSVEPTKEGYTFMGWATTSDATDAIYEAGDEFTLDANTTLYAVWKSGVSLYNLMKNNALTTAIDFKVNSGESGTNGIYTTTETDSGKPVYYYRGSYSSVNNNLIFNNFCWKIIRTTETGGVKIIYNGTPTDGKCETQTGEGTQIGKSAFNTNYDDNAYVGYMYGTPGLSTYNATHANTNDSDIKIMVDNWYENNMTNVTSKLEDTVFCNDRSTKAYDANTIGDSNMSSYGALGYGTNATFYGAAHRASYISNNPAPTLKCAQANDKFTVGSTNGNGKLTYPVGLITNDEVVFAGFNTKYSNTSNYEDITNYLYTNQYYWALSPVFKYGSGSANVGVVNYGGNLSSSGVVNSFGVRPAVSLADGTLVESSGNGSTTNPYVVR